jgi:hypothetical protein
MSYNLTFMENGTAQDIAIGIIVNLPLLIPLFSIFEFFVILSVGAGFNARRTGYSNMIEWGLVSALTTATSMVLISGIFATKLQYDIYILSTMIVWFAIVAVLLVAVYLKKE